MDNKAIGLRIEQRRKDLGLTLEDVAKEIGVAKSTVQRYEKGTIDKIKLPVIEAIARVLDVNPAWICFKDTDMTRDGIFDLHPEEYPQDFLSKLDESYGKAAIAFYSEMLSRPTATEICDLVVNTLNDNQLKQIKACLDSASDVYRLLSLYWQLNKEGCKKLVDYADDMVRSGKYKKNNPNSLAERKTIG